MPTIGALRRNPPMEPRNGASPKLKMPPSEPCSQYPPPSRVAVMPTTAAFSAQPGLERAPDSTKKPRRPEGPAFGLQSCRGVFPARARVGLGGRPTAESAQKSPGDLLIVVALSIAIDAAQVAVQIGVDSARRLD